MSTLDQVRQGLSKAWDTLTEGWQELRDLAGDALTRFQPKSDQGEGEDGAETGHPLSRVSRWGLLAAEVRDQGDKISVSLEMPGLEKDDFDLQIHDDVLVVRGEKRSTRDEVQGAYHVMERAYGAFERAIRLPAAVEYEGASATYRAGVLSVSLNKSKGGDARRITVDVK